MYVTAAAMGEYTKEGDSLDREWSGLLQRWGSQGGLGRQSGQAERQFGSLGRQSGQAERQFGSLGRQSSRREMGRQPSFPSGYVVVEENKSIEDFTRQSSTGQIRRQSSTGQIRRQSIREQGVSNSQDQCLGTRVSNGNLNRQTSCRQFTKQTSKGQLNGKDSERRQTNYDSAQADVCRRSRSKSAARRSRSSSPSRLFASTASSRAKQTDASTGTSKAPRAKQSSRISKSTARSQSISKSLAPKSTSPPRARQPREANASAVPRRRSSSDDWHNASCDEEEGHLASYLSFQQFADHKRQNTRGRGTAGERKISNSTQNRSSISSNFERRKFGSPDRPSISPGKTYATSRSYSASGSSAVTRQKKSVGPVSIALATLKEATVTPSDSYNRGSFQERMTSSSSSKRKSVSSTFIG